MADTSREAVERLMEIHDARAQACRKHIARYGNSAHSRRLLTVAEETSLALLELLHRIEVAEADRDAALTRATKLRTMLKAALSALEGAAQDVDACAHLNDDYFQESICTRIRAALAQEPPA